MQNGGSTRSARDKAPVDCVSCLSTSNAPGNAPGSFLSSPISRSPCLSMSSVANSWNNSAVPLSVYTNGSATQLSPAKNTLPLETTEVKFSSSNASGPALKERDYIGLWDSFSPYVQGVTASTAVPSPSFGVKEVDLHAKETELRLGLGLSLVSRANGDEIDSAQKGLLNEANLECSVSQINSSKNRVSEQIVLPERQHVAASQADTHEIDSEKYLAAHDENGRGVSENVPLAAPSLAARTYVPQGSLSNRKGEQQLLSQRGCLPQQGKSYYNADAVSKNSKQNEFFRKEAPHHLVNGQPLTAKSLIGGSELRFAPHDVVAPTETGPPYDAPAAQKFWQIQMSRPIEGYRSLPGQSANVTEVALAPGRYAVPVPKVSTVPAKRPFFDTIGEHKGTCFVHDSPNDPRGNAAAAGAPTHGGLSPDALGTSATENEVKYGASQTPKVHTASGFYPWTNVVQLAGGWQPVPAQFKAPTPANAPTHEPASEAKTPAKPGRIDVQNEDSGSRAAVVGWPPIRSFRKNTLAAHAKPNDDDLDVAGEASTTHFVKARLEGAKVQRKVDLNSCSSHESLKVALQKLFEGFINGPNGGSNTGESEEFDLVHGSDYVIAYDDFDGDLMLARDVPWEDFVTKVKRLCVMKASEAKVGSAKLGTQSMSMPK